MAKVQVSATIEVNDHARWKRSGMRIGHLIKLGLDFAEQKPGFISRIEELEVDKSRLAQKLVIALRRLNEIEARELNEVNNGN
jgi:hypothetical protein